MSQEREMLERSNLEQEKKLLEEEISKINKEIDLIRRSDSQYSTNQDELNRYLNNKISELKKFNDDEQNLLNDIDDENILKKTKEENNPERNHIQRKIDEINHFMELSQRLNEIQQK